MDPARPPAKTVGDEFAKQYYGILQDFPHLLRNFYKDFSKIGRTRNNGMISLDTLSDIDDENLQGVFDSAEVTTTRIISRDCQAGGVLVVVGGYSTLKMMKFIQVFLLAPQEKPDGYFVLLDLLHFEILSASNVVAEKVTETEVTRREVAQGLLGVSEPNDGREASAVIQKGQHQSCDPNDDTGNGNNQVLTESSTVHVKNLPPNDTFAKVENAFKTFGAIKKIRVKNPGLDFYYAFVEFKEANAANRAIKASPVVIDGRKVPVAKARDVVRNASLAYDYYVRQNPRGNCLISKPSDPQAPSAKEVWEAFSKKEKCKRQEEEGRRGADHSRDYEHRKIQEEQRKLQEEKMKLQEEKTKFQEEKMKLQEEKTKFQEEKMKLQEERMKLQEEKIQEEKTKFQEEKTKFQEAKSTLQEEKTKFQEEKMKLQEEQRKLKERIKD